MNTPTSPKFQKEPNIMSIDKHFPIIFHAIIAGLTIGASWGLHKTPDTPLVIVGMVTGLAAALAFTCLVRILDSV